MTINPSDLSDAALAGLISTTIEQACFGDEQQFPLDETIDRWFAQDYRQYTDGHSLDLAAFRDHLALLRSRVSTGHVEVLELIHEGRRVADRHLVTMTRADGTTSTIEMMMFARFDDSGRIQQAGEMSQVLRGDSRDRSLVSDH